MNTSPEEITQAIVWTIMSLIWLTFMAFYIHQWLFWE